MQVVPVVGLLAGLLSDLLNGQLQSVHVLTIVCIKLFLLLENALTPILRPSNWKFESSPRPHSQPDLGFSGFSGCGCGII